MWESGVGRKPAPHPPGIYGVTAIDASPCMVERLGSDYSEIIARQMDAGRIFVGAEHIHPTAASFSCSTRRCI
jgi:hypothetical protein